MPCPDASIVDEYIGRQLGLNQLIMMSTQEAKKLGVQYHGMIPKSKPGSWRLIVDLSAPEGSSVNDGIGGKMSRLSCWAGVHSCLRWTLSRLPACPSPPRQEIARYPVARGGVRRQMPAFWPALCPHALLGSGGCSSVDNAGLRCRALHQ
jgi:hypothetical protein